MNIWATQGVDLLSADWPRNRGAWRFRVYALWSMPRSRGVEGERSTSPRTRTRTNMCQLPDSAVPGLTPRGVSSKGNNAIEGLFFDHGKARRRC